jgi:hypothetical protein
VNITKKANFINNGGKLTIKNVFEIFLYLLIIGIGFIVTSYLCYIFNLPRILVYVVLGILILKFQDIKI